jgi:transketolase
MRDSFVKGLERIMEDERVSGNRKTYLLTGDLGFSVFENIRKNYGDFFVNAGVSEQNMIGVAAGMAKLGKSVFVYSIIPFLLYRTFEQVRNDVCYHNLNVKLVGVGAGLAYSEAGATHHPLEDLKVADAIPNLTILNPSDPFEVEIFMRDIRKLNGPVYMRLSRNGDQVFHSSKDNIEIGKALRLIDGDDVLIVSTGVLTKNAVDAAKRLGDDGISTEVLEISTFRPFDEESVRNSARGKRIVATVEDNTGALSEKVARVIAGTGIYQFLNFKLPDDFTHMAGTRNFLFKTYGLDVDSIYTKIRERL